MTVLVLPKSDLVFGVISRPEKVSHFWALYHTLYSLLLLFVKFFWEISRLKKLNLLMGTYVLYVLRSY